MIKERFKIVPSVYLLLIKNCEILLSRRYNTGFCDGQYSLPAGHLDGNETLIEALLREIKEEIDIQLDLFSVKLVHVMSRKSDEERVDFFFTTNTYQGEPKIMELDKCGDLNWFKLDKLPEDTIPYIRQVIESVQNNIFYSEYGW